MLFIISCVCLKHQNFSLWWQKHQKKLVFSGCQELRPFMYSMFLHNITHLFSKIHSKFNSPFILWVLLKYEMSPSSNTIRWCAQLNNPQVTDKNKNPIHLKRERKSSFPTINKENSHSKNKKKLLLFRIIVVVWRYTEAEIKTNSILCSAAQEQKRMKKKNERPRRLAHFIVFHNKHF